MYTIFSVNGEEYKCKLTTQAIIDLEKKFGKNLLSILVDMEEDDAIPPLNDLLIILHASLQKFNHGMKFDDVIDLYDDYSEEYSETHPTEMPIQGLITFIYSLYQDSGLLPKGEKKEEKPKKVKQEKN